MRMRELVEATGVPRTTIHHYLREGLLPPPTKTAANAAVYGEEHVERLQLIRALRGAELGPFSLAGVRAVLSVVDSGVDPAVAARLQKATPGLAIAESAAGKDGLSRADLAREADVPLSVVEQLAEGGLLRSAVTRGGAEAFDVTDVGIVRVYAELLRDTRLEPEDLAPIAELIGEILRYESALADVAAADLDAGGAAILRGRVAKRLDAVHAYLLTRSRV